MTTKSTLFYGIFVDVIPLVIATTIHFDILNIYDPLILELSSYRSHNNLANIPLETWQQIKDELRQALLIKLEVDFVSILSCDCCRNGACSDLETHSVKLWDTPGHAILIPAYPEDTTIHYRECCSNSVCDRSLGGVECFEQWFSTIGFTRSKLDEFLSPFNLYLLDPNLLDNNQSYYYCFAIASGKSVEHEGDNTRNDDSCLAYEFTEFSTSLLKKFNYTKADEGFQRLKLEYHIYEADLKNRRATGTVAELDDDAGPYWKLWCRTESLDEY